MADIRSVTIAEGVAMPQLGLGVFKVKDEEAAATVATAIKAGYRSIDTAAIYENETGTGEGIRQAGVGRDEIFVTSKLWNDRQGDVRAAFDETREKLGVEVLDLYLIHWPSPKNDRYVDAWRALATLRDEGLVRAIGVSNFKPAHLQRIIDETGVIPAINQVELHPYLQQTELRDFHRRHGITTEAWSPIGQGKQLLEDAVIGRIAEAHSKSPAQIVLRWHLQNDIVVIPKSSNPSRIRENIDVADFELDRIEMQAIDGLDRNARLGPDPDNFG